MSRTTKMCAFVLALIVPVMNAAAGETARKTLTIETSTGPHEFLVEIAETPDARSRGLMYRESLPVDHGMLFIYDAPRKVSMWMKNTFISLDMLFIREDGVVVKAAQFTEPHSLDSISSGSPVTMVLEIVAGTVDRLGIKKGDRVYRSADDQ